MSQKELSMELDLSRNTTALESGKTIKRRLFWTLLNLYFFNLSVNCLLKVDLSKLGELKLKERLAGNSA